MYIWHQHDSHPLHGELDGRVGDEHEGGLGAVPQGGDALLNPDLTKAVKQTAVSGKWADEKGFKESPGCAWVQASHLEALVDHPQRVCEKDIDATSKN